jgi:hypothetical protein
VDETPALQGGRCEAWTERRVSLPCRAHAIRLTPAKAAPFGRSCPVAGIAGRCVTLCQVGTRRRTDIASGETEAVSASATAIGEDLSHGIRNCRLALGRALYRNRCRKLLAGAHAEGASRSPFTTPRVAVGYGGRWIGHAALSRRASARFFLDCRSAHDEGRSPGATVTWRLTTRLPLIYVAALLLWMALDPPRHLYAAPQRQPWTPHKPARDGASR